RTLDGTRRKGEALLVEILHHGDRGAQFAEGLEKQARRFLYVLIRIEDDLPCWGLDKTNRQLGGQFTPGRLVAQAALETCTHGKELRFGHGPLQSEYQAIIEVRQIIHRIGVIDQRLIETADLKQLVVYLYRAGNSVARKSGTIPPYHDHVRGTLPWDRTSFS